MCSQSNVLKFLHFRVIVDGPGFWSCSKFCSGLIHWFFFPVAAELAAVSIVSEFPRVCMFVLIC